MEPVYNKTILKEKNIVPTIRMLTSVTLYNSSSRDNFNLSPYTCAVCYLGYTG